MARKCAAICSSIIVDELETIIGFKNNIIVITPVNEYLLCCVGRDGVPPGKVRMINSKVSSYLQVLK